MAINAFFVSTFIFALRAAAFNLYPTVNPDNLAKSFGISIDCLDALNETIPCDETLFQMSNTVDSYLWTTENVTDLCTTDCIASTAKWWSDVQGRCEMDNIAAYGKMIPAESIVGRFFDGLSIACLQSSSNSNSSEPYSNHSSVPTGSAPFANATSTSTGSALYSNPSSTSNKTPSGPSWCLIESQEWVGSDIIRPDCSTNATDQSCLDPSHLSPESERIANLYPNDMLCSDCFIKMFHQRMSSPYLPDSDHSDYLVAQYQDILDVCQASMPELVVRSLPFYGDAPVNYGAMSTGSPAIPPFSSNGTQYINGTNGTTACTGQTICTADLDGPAFSNGNSSFCDALSEKYSVTTGDLAAVLDNPYCLPTYSSYCVPAACALARVPPDATCDSISSSNTISTLQFRNWNPNINGLCDSLQEGDYVCIGAPGGSYIPPPVSNTSTDVSAEQRGGSDTGASINTTAPFRNSTAATNTASSPPSKSPSSASVAPSPTQKGISTTCTNYSQAKHGDFCSTFAQANNITPAQLYTLNEALGSTGQNCNTAFWSGYYYCVGSSTTPAHDGSDSAPASVPMSTILSTTDATPTSTTSPDPIPTVLSTIMSTLISTIDASPPSTTPLSPIPTPTIANAAAAAAASPTQSGIASPCAKYAQAHTGDTCLSFAASNGISAADLYARNTVLGSKGENCGTKFWGGYYYCVGGSD